MGGWLILTQPGLSPSKKRQASLDAPTAVILCSYCPPFFKVHFRGQEKHNDARKAKREQEKVRAIIGLGFLIFFLPKEIGKNQKTQPGNRVDGGRYRPTSLLPGYTSP
jgi:hypothetical protein